MATQYTAGITQGQVWTAAIANQIGAAWETWTPTVNQAGAVTATVNYARYSQIQKLVIAAAYVTVTGTGTGANAVTLSLPLTCQSAGSQIIGTGFIFDASANALYTVSAQTSGTTAAAFYYGAASAGSFWGINPNIAVANNDQIRILFTYEAA